MKKFFRIHHDLAITLAGSTILIVLALYFILGVRVISETLGEAGSVSADGRTGTDFNLNGARQILKARGLIE